MKAMFADTRLFQRWLLVAATGAVAAFIAFWVYRTYAGNTVPFHTYALQTGSKDWTPIGGDWIITNGVVVNNSPERGAKLLTGSDYWQNLTFTTEMKFTGTNADMGVIIRVNVPRQGADSYNGYYIGLRTLDGTIVVGRSDFGWREAPPVHVPGGVVSNVWYRLRVIAYGCNIAASVQNSATLQTAWIAFRESGCVSSGRIGLRSLNAGGMWRNISIAPATWNDYLQLSQHATAVEYPEVVPGPPWWTPLHAGILFGSLLAFLLLLQLVYFRIQQWKAYTITRERERLAHDIHDTMAQSFAGIGYQIQGIYHHMRCGGPVDSAEIADQLHVAYQLVHRCHEEASRTIAMLGSSLPLTRQNILDALKETATKIAGERIKVVAQSHGTSAPLNLRLADALLHIGREAIVNAVDHSGLSTLEIVLSYNKTSVELAIKDNGCGFEFSQKTIGFGILGMQKRARDVGATLQILSRPGMGTRVKVSAGIHPENLIARIVAGIRRALSPSGIAFHLLRKPLSRLSFRDAYQPSPDGSRYCFGAIIRT